MAVTSPRVAVLSTIAAAHQTAFGSAASSAGTLARAQVLFAEVKRNPSYADGFGTNYSEFPKNTITEVATAPTARLRCYLGANPFSALILEHAFHGQPAATSAAGDLTESGDTAGVLGTWVLNGVRPGFNTSATYHVYVSLVDETPAGGATVNVYSDSARSALVATGSGLNSTTVTLAASGSSGLSGTVALGAPAASNAGIELRVVSVRPQRANTVSRYFTLFLDTSAELVTLTDCVVQRLRIGSARRGCVIADVDILASTYTVGATTLAASTSEAAARFYCHGTATATHNSNTQSPLLLEHGIEHEYAVGLANAASPTAFAVLSSKVLPIVMRLPFSTESRTIRNDGASMTSRAVAATYTYAGRDMSWSWPTCYATEAELPGQTDGAWDEHVLTLDARDDGTNAPVAVTMEL